MKWGFTFNYNCQCTCQVRDPFLVVQVTSTQLFFEIFETGIIADVFLYKV